MRLNAALVTHRDSEPAVTRNNSTEANWARRSTLQTVPSFKDPSAPTPISGFALVSIRPSVVYFVYRI
jgi:hypothetical protein